MAAAMASEASEASKRVQSEMHGWAPVGQALLREYAEQQQEAAMANVKGSWQDVSASMRDLLPWALDHLKLLYAVDCFPNGGLCQGDQLKEAIRRYEQVWLPLIARVPGGEPARAALAPPLDVAFVWHLHRLCGQTYEADVRLLLGSDVPTPHPEADQAFRFTDGSDEAGQATARAWAQASPGEPFWPPRPGQATAAFTSKLSADLAAMAVRQPIFLHQVLRDEYRQRPFLLRARDRYAKFLLLRKRRQVTLGSAIPPLDVELLMRTHASASAAWHRDWRAMLGGPPPPPAAGTKSSDDSGSLDRSQAGAWRYTWSETRRAWTEDYAEAFVVPGSGFVSMDTQLPAERATAPYAGAYNDDEAGGSWRAGAHALYIEWLQREGRAADAAARAAGQAARPAKRKGGLFSCFSGGHADGDDHAAAAAGPASPARGAGGEGALQRQLAGFAQLRNLPFTPAHAFWATLVLSGPEVAAATPAGEAAEVETYDSPQQVHAPPPA